MDNTFALDLAAARRKSGLAQKDCAHLLNVHRGRISNIEAGRLTPTLNEFCLLSIIYGRSFESLFASVMAQSRSQLRRRLPTLPEGSDKHLSRFNRNNTLNRLAAQLEDSHNRDHGQA